jgi:hypothetical protein
VGRYRAAFETFAPPWKALVPSSISPAGNVDTGDKEPQNCGNHHPRGRITQLRNGLSIYLRISTSVYDERITTAPHDEREPPRPQTDYRRSGLAAEAVVGERFAKCDVSWTILRPTAVFGPRGSTSTRFFQVVPRRRTRLHGPAVGERPIAFQSWISLVAEAQQFGCSK